MDLPIKKSFKVEDGAHEGVIIDVQYKTEPKEYTQVIIEHLPKDGQAIRLTAGYPTCVSKESMLGKLMERFGVTLVEGASIDPTKVLANKACTFMTLTNKTDKGEFSNIIRDTLKPKV